MVGNATELYFYLWSDNILLLFVGVFMRMEYFDRVLLSAHIIWKLVHASMVQPASLTTLLLVRSWHWQDHKGHLKPLEEKQMQMKSKNGRSEVPLDWGLRKFSYFESLVAIFFLPSCVLNHLSLTQYVLWLLQSKVLYQFGRRSCLTEFQALYLHGLFKVW